MAITLLSNLDKVVPAYNPVVWVFNSDESSILGFRYLFNLYKHIGLTTQLIGTFRVAPDLNGNGQFDISKLLQSNIDSTINFNDSVSLLDDLSMCRYDIECIEEFPFYETFTDYEFGGYWVSFPITGSVYNVGDLVYIQLDDITITDSRAQLNGYHTVVTVTGTDIEIDVLYSSIGAGPTTPGKVYYADRRKVTGDELLEEDYIAYNAAIPFKNWPNWSEYLVLPQDAGGDEPESDILTNSPNYLKTYSEEDKYIIKKYQELYWNVFNNPSNDDETILANTMIVENEFGDRWMLVNYDNWDTTGIKMRQFDVSPNNQNWINITPNWGTGTFYNTAFNPYTHINSDSSLSYSKYLDYWTTFSPGYDECDAISIEITQDPVVPGPPTTTFQFTARPVGRGFNQRRVYHTLIDDKNAFLVSEVDPGPQRIWSLYMNDNFNPQAVNTIYSVFAKRTSNSVPYGTCNGSSNDVDAWKAFDGDPLTYWQTTSGTGTGTLTYNMPYDSAIGWARPYSYSLSKGFTTTNAPKDWTFQASRDGGSTWTILHTVTGNTSVGQYNSPAFSIGTAYTRFRIVVTAVIGGSNVRINEFSVKGLSRVARMVSSGDCPTSGGFLYWVIQGGPMPEWTSLLLGTTAVGPYTYQTLKTRRVYLDYDCEINDAQLLFLDRQGSYSSFNMPLRIIESGNNTKLNYRNTIGDYDSTIGDWTYETSESEIKTYSSTIEKTFTLSTDWINEGMSDYFEELITSPQVWVKFTPKSEWLACTVVNNEFINPKKKNKKLINRQVTIKLNSNNIINI